jgi:hypothetical protein
MMTRAHLTFDSLVSVEKRRDNWPTGAKDTKTLDKAEGAILVQLVPLV